MSVAEALALPELRRGLPEVLAGESELGRPIRWVHASEVSNIASLLTGGELLLTTGIALSGPAADGRRIVRELAAGGLAALVVELGSALGAVPEPVRAEAAAFGLPLVVLHREVPFIKVTEAIHTELVNRRYGLLREGENIRQRLIDVMLGGEGVAEVLSRFSEIVGNPVFLESADGSLLFHAGSRDDLDAWEGSRHRRDGVVLQRPVPMGRARNPGRLVVLATARTPTALDGIALDQAAAIVALALLRAREEEELVVRQRGNLLADLAAGAIPGPDAAGQAAQIGFRARNPLLLAFAFQETPLSSPPSRAALLGELQRTLDGRGLSVLAGGPSHQDPLFALVSVPRAEDRAATAEQVAGAIHAAWDHRRPGTSVVVAVDGPSGWDGAGEALAAAAATVPCAAALVPRAWHDAHALELERLLWGLRAQGALAEYVQRNLGPLLQRDRERKLKLIPTLEVLCRTGGHKAEAARELSLHRQALYHRISRIEALLGVDLSDPARLLTLHLALLARSYVAR
jgi:purine catabolism regulator